MTPTERQRKVKPKGKAVFNNKFQLFSESRWEDGDMFCFLDHHKNPEAAEVLDARAEKSMIHIYIQWGKGCWLHCNTAPIFSWLSPAWTWTSTLIEAWKGKKLSKVLILSGGGLYNAQSLAQAAGVCQVTLCNAGDASCPDLRLKWGGEPVLREKNPRRVPWANKIYSAVENFSSTAI